MAAGEMGDFRFPSRIAFTSSRQAVRKLRRSTVSLFSISNHGEHRNIQLRLLPWAQIESPLTASIAHRGRSWVHFNDRLPQSVVEASIDKDQAIAFLNWPIELPMLFALHSSNFKHIRKIDIEQ